MRAYVLCAQAFCARFVCTIFTPAEKNKEVLVMRFFIIFISFFLVRGPLFAETLQNDSSMIKHDYLELAFHVDEISFEWEIESGLFPTDKNKGNPKGVSLKWEFHESLDAKGDLQLGDSFPERDFSPCDSVEDTIAESVFSGDIEGLIYVLVVLAIIYG